MAFVKKIMARLFALITLFQNASTNIKVDGVLHASTIQSYSIKYFSAFFYLCRIQKNINIYSLTLI